jgi:hypothetical protein
VSSWFIAQAREIGEEGEVKKLLLSAVLLSACGGALWAAAPAADDNPLVVRYEVANVAMAQIPPAPRHLDDMLALVRDGSVMVMLYQHHQFAKLTMDELNDVQLCMVAQKARARSLADRLLIITDHRVQLTPRDPREIVSIDERHARVADLPALLAAYGDVKVE